MEQPQGQGRPASDDHERFFGARRVSALGSEGDNETAPSGTEGVDFATNVLAITTMGIDLLWVIVQKDGSNTDGRP